MTIYTTITQEDALELVELGRTFHKESRFSKGPYNEEAIWKLLKTVVKNPETFYISFYRNIDNKIVGFILGQLTEEFFTGTLLAKDLSMFVDKEHRGSFIFVKLLKAFENWAKDKGAQKMMLFHATGIGSEKASSLFTRLGYAQYGFIFDKEF